MEIIYIYFAIVTKHKTGRLNVEFLLSQHVARTVTTMF